MHLFWDEWMSAECYERVNIYGRENFYRTKKSQKTILTFKNKIGGTETFLWGTGRRPHELTIMIGPSK